jgi:phosphoribosylformimino-5-aminoimidazole carboxamide ribotide isomerase
VELYPAIDIRAGRVVRMRRGDPSSQIVYHDDPMAVALAYADAGARWVHVVDLDRVFGFGEQTSLIADIARHVPARFQVGGALTTAGDVAPILDGGAERAIVRAGAASEPGGLAALARRFGGARLAVGIDLRTGTGAGRGAGGAEGCDAPGATALARAAVAAGIGTVILTDLGREGCLGGADVERAGALARETGARVVLSGGVHSLEEISRARDAGLAGAIVGRALFEGRFTLEEALACSSR